MKFDNCVCFLVFVVAVMEVEADYVSVPVSVLYTLPEKMICSESDSNSAYGTSLPQIHSDIFDNLWRRASFSNSEIATNKAHKARIMQDDQDSMDFIALISSDSEENRQKSKFVKIFAVYDGHGKNGKKTSEFLRAKLISKISTHPNLQTDTKRALYESFHHINEELRQSREAHSGSTATVIVLIGNKIYCAWIGDCEARIYFSDKVVNLTPFLHNAENKEEVSRVLENGGSIYGNRLSGSLLVTRSFGDFEYEPGMTSKPSISEYTLCDQEIQNTGYLVVGSDGFWDNIYDMLVRRILFTDESLTKRDLAREKQEESESGQRYFDYHMLYTQDISTSLAYLSLASSVGVQYPEIADDCSVVCVEFGGDANKNILASENSDYGRRMLISQGISILMSPQSCETLDLSLPPHQIKSISVAETSVRQILEEHFTNEDWIHRSSIPLDDPESAELDYLTNKAYLKTLIKQSKSESRLFEKLREILTNTTHINKKQKN